ncbi:hypothetical protein M3649_17795 [Ureibacillus chungkukjangi]|uniref:hypothetical protein n=1 Tax=Ureibacillus chungkukjangi TaxID=1202712 RepID=UPI00203F12B3|nr:hypothetical protein [Ureibacillus chungkukjangi]MCM3389975.1 hypothetical protein [Ureibacillus chungkukjangi]
MKPAELLEGTVLKECVGCGTDFVTIAECSDDVQYCSDTCKESHSLFNETQE